MRINEAPATFAVLVAALALAGCTSTRDALITRGFDPAYAEGYDAGCSSGKVAAGGLFGESRKDADRYAADTPYTQGWDDGFAKCQSDMAEMVRDARLRHPSGSD